MNIKAKVAAFAAAAGLVMAGGGAAYAATTGGEGHHHAQQIVCVKYGPKGGKDATGNYMLWDWNRSACPAGTYKVVLGDDDNWPQPVVTPPATPTGGASTGTTTATPMGQS